MNTFYITYKKVFEILPTKFKKKFFLIQLLIIITSIVDLLGLAVFVPIISLISNEDFLNKNKYFVLIKDYLKITENKDLILLLFLLALIFFIVRMLIILLSTYLQNKFTFSLSEYTGRKTYEYYLNSTYEDFQKREEGKILVDLNTNAINFSKYLVNPLLLITTEVISILLIISGIIAYDYKIFLLLLFTIIPIVYFFNKFFKTKANSYGIELNDLFPQFNVSMIRAVNGFIDIKLRNKEKNLIDDYIDIFNKIRDIQVKMLVINVIPAKLIELSTVVGLIIIFIYGAYVQNDTSFILTLIAIYSVSAYKISPSISKILPSLINLEQYQYVFDIYSRTLKERKKDFGKEKIKFEKSIELNNLFFRYQGADKYTFKEFNLSINKGEIVGLKGSSGGGKTTLVKIISGFLIPEKGDILVDGVKLSNKNIINWMSQISYVQQSPYIEKGSLTSNIAFLEDNPDIEKVNEAIELASLKDLIENTSPNDFYISENGKNLSGGQKQRIIIARAIYHKSNLIILDEATSALDNETEDKINETVLNLKKKGYTLIIIAHRLSTLQNADKIIDIKLKNDK